MAPVATQREHSAATVATATVARPRSVLDLDVIDQVLVELFGRRLLPDDILARIAMRKRRRL